jgi:hypothetical protein
MTYVGPAWEFGACLGIWGRNCNDCKTRFSTSVANLQGTLQLEICIMLFKFHMYMTIKPNNAGSKHKSFKIMKIHIFEMLDKAKPNTENIRLNSVAVKHMTVKEIKIPL